MTGMSPSDDFFAEEIRMPREVEKAVPPSRHAFPVAHRPPLERHTMVTTGRPGWWFIDELVVTNGPFENEGETCYDVMPWAEWGASMVRRLATEEEFQAQPRRAFGRSIKASELWVYLDGKPQADSIDEVKQPGSLDWYERIMQTTEEPPPVLHPRPARELPSLIGRRLLVSGFDGGWMWRMGLSEPIDEPGGYTAIVCPPRDYWQSLYGYIPKDSAWTQRPLLHTLWTY